MTQMDVTTERDGESLTVTVEGEIDAHTCEELTARLDAELVDGVSSLVVEAAGIDFVDSSGLRVLVKAANRLDGSVTIRGASDTFRRLLEITGLVDDFRLES
jgi:stage II sporulation protein AA (anti-sigma F factor antagonist)